jgi:SAM-dependent methyltransferase
MQYSGHDLRRPLSATAAPPKGLKRLRVVSHGSPSQWYDFYHDRIGKAEYRRYVARQYKPFLDAIHQEASPGDCLLEVGCGMGTITHILREYARFRPMVALDNDQKMYHVARRELHGMALVVHADMRDCDWVTADVIHGHGVLEHLDDHDIYRTLEAHSRSGAKAAIHYVPGIKHGSPSFGDERLLPLEWWVDKWDVDEAHTFNDGKDYVLIWRF